MKFPLIKVFSIKNKKELKRIAVKLLTLVLSFVVIYLLKLLLTKVSFTDSIDLADPDYIPRELVDFDIERRTYAFLGFLVFFAMIAVIIGRWQGFASIIGLILSAFTIYELMVPLILKGWHPIPLTFFCGVIIITTTIFISHGVNKKTVVALSGSFFSLFTILAISMVFRSLLQISGYSSEDTFYLLSMSQLDFDMGSVLISGVILSGIGILDDITLTQASVVHELSKANSHLDTRKLYSKAMNVGKDHAAAAINSIFWIYAASSLPLLLLASYDFAEPHDFLYNGSFMEDALRTVSASIGLMFAIPLTTILAALVYSKRK
ncbi:YibE/F family protein [Candidatus Dojkabacteria bacterium]|nr:YibE/F family protein [Candidatus Dojkabacteria bacterium]